MHGHLDKFDFLVEEGHFPVSFSDKFVSLYVYFSGGFISSIYSDLMI